MARLIGVPFLPKGDDYLMMMLDHMPVLMQGLKLTLYFALLSIFFGFVIGIIVALMKIAPFKPLQFLASAYINIIRGTPLLVQLFFIYFGLNMLEFVSLDRVPAGILALSLNAGAYFAETTRAGIQSIQKGQVEASRSIGFSAVQTMRFIVLPQAIRRMLPAYVNQATITLKDTSLLSVIGIADLIQKGDVIQSATYQPLAVWTTIGIIYFVVIYLLTLVSNYLEKRVEVK